MQYLQYAGLAGNLIKYDKIATSVGLLPSLSRENRRSFLNLLLMHIKTIAMKDG